MFREWKTGKGYLKIPIEAGAEKIRLRILVNLCGNPEEKNLLSTVLFRSLKTKWTFGDLFWSEAQMARRCK